MIISRRVALAGVGAAAVVRPARAATVLRWASVLSVNHPGVAMMNRVAADVLAQTNGMVEIQTFPAGQLGSSRDVIEAASSGAIQIVDEGAAQFGQFVAPFSILEAPYLWRDPAHMRRALAAPLMDDMRAQLVSKRDMRVIGSTYYGTRHVTAGSRAVRTVGDMAGFKLRIPEVDTYRAMAEAWGARATPMNIGELYLALSQGAVDGQENPLPTIQASKFNEVQKYLVLTAHILTPRLVVVNEAAWKGLDPRGAGGADGFVGDACAGAGCGDRAAGGGVGGDVPGGGDGGDGAGPGELSQAGAGGGAGEVCGEVGCGALG